MKYLVLFLLLTGCVPEPPKAVCVEKDGEVLYCVLAPKEGEDGK